MTNACFLMSRGSSLCYSTCLPPLFLAPGTSEQFVLQLARHVLQTPTCPNPSAVLDSSDPQDLSWAGRAKTGCSLMNVASKQCSSSAAVPQPPCRTRRRVPKPAWLQAPGSSAQSSFPSREPGFASSPAKLTDLPCLLGSPPKQRHTSALEQAHQCPGWAPAQQRGESLLSRQRDKGQQPAHKFALLAPRLLPALLAG